VCVQRSADRDRGTAYQNEKSAANSATRRCWPELNHYERSLDLAPRHPGLSAAGVRSAARDFIAIPDRDAGRLFAYAVVPSRHRRPRSSRRAEISSASLPTKAHRPAAAASRIVRASASSTVNFVGRRVPFRSLQLPPFARQFSFEGSVAAPLELPSGKRGFAVSTNPSLSLHTLTARSTLNGILAASGVLRRHRASSPPPDSARSSGKAARERSECRRQAGFEGRHLGRPRSASPLWTAFQ
jgi:hypothetical protein